MLKSPKIMKIAEWPKQERPREKLLAQGAGNLSNTELLAILIGSGSRNYSAMDAAQGLLSRLGSLRAIIRADHKTLCACKGIGDVRFVLLQAALELVRRSLFETLEKGEALTSPNAARDYLKLKMGDYEHEVFACMFLDSQHRILGFEEMFHGTIDSADVHPREVVKRALHYNAAAVIFVHNHPSGSHEPSKADENITKELKRSLELIDVRVLDHFVVGEKITSLVERRML